MLGLRTYSGPEQLCSISETLNAISSTVKNEKNKNKNKPMAKAVILYPGTLIPKTSNHNCQTWPESASPANLSTGSSLGGRGGLVGA